MNGQSTPARVLTPEILMEIDLILEEFYPKSVSAGKALAEVKLRNAQIRGLETLITSTSRFSEVINYIKNQAGKDKRGQWSKTGPLLLEQLEFIEVEAGKLGQGDPAMILAIKMKLARGWAKQVTTHYLFQSAQQGGR